MAYCEYNPGISDSNPYARLTVTQSSTNIANNTSTISYSLVLYRPYNISSSASKDYSITINGTKVKSGTTTLGGSGNKTIASGTTTVTHNADGSKTLSFSFSLEFGISWSGKSIGTGTASGTTVLTKIPRITTPTVNKTTADFGTSITISMPRLADSFKHTLKYTFKGTTGTIGSDLDTSKAWTIPNSLMDKIPNATRDVLTITCETYSGSTKLGSKTVDVTVTVPSSVKPSVSLNVAEGVANIKTKFNAYVKGLSKLSITTTASGSYSSTIKSYKITANGQTFTTSTATTGLLSKSGSQTVTVTVTDSRGRTNSASNTITVLDYSKPTITTFTGFRANSSGVYTDDGSYIQLNLIGKVTNITGNTATYSIGYKKSSASSYTNTNLSVTALNINTTHLLANMDTESTYDIIFTITDAIGNKATATINISTAFTLVDYHSSGKGISFGKVAEESNVADFGIKAKFRNGENPEGAIVIQPNTDINTLIEPGYYVFSSATSSTLSNLPFTNASSGGITVIREGESTQIRQIITRCSTNREVWERLYYSNTWQSTQCIYKGGNRVLWSGSSLMSGSDTITLSQKIDSQVNGIVLVFSRYSSSTTRDYHFNSFFISKNFVELMPGVGNTFIMSTDGSFSVMATKYLYIHNDKITGNDINTTSGTGTSNVKYENNGFVLRYVIGV